MSRDQRPILRQYERLEAQRKKIMDMLPGLPENIYRHAPAPGKWSVGQIANHLYWSEKRSLDYLRKKLSYPDSVPRYHPGSWLGLWLTRLVFFTGYKIKAPEAIDMEKINEVMPPDLLREKWESLRKDMIGFILDHDEAFGSHLAFRHPFAGRMTFYQMLRFFQYHIRHHQRQIEHILRQVGHQ